MRDIRHQDEEKRRHYHSIQVSLFFFIFFNACSVAGYAQQYLTTPISLKVEEVRLDSVLQKIGKIGGFYFSYRSDALPKDSLVSLSVNQEPVEKILNVLLKDVYEYKEAPGYVILRLAPNRLQLLTDDSPDYGKIQSISGYVVDDQTGEEIPYASVYEKRLLLSALTDERGFFRMKIKNPVSSISLTVSKEYYRDTTVVLLAPVLVSDNSGGRRFAYRHGEGLFAAERTAAGRFLVSSKQKFQSLNLGGFFANAPVQTSLIPGLSTQGSLSSQVVNDLSLNILGGYTFGVKGLELAGLFNINKADMRAVQAAGVFNLVGGRVHGVQLAGINNTVLDTVAGVQVSGLYNRNQKSTKGIQLAGLFNLSQGDLKGLQFAGLANVSNGRLKGIQLSTINYAKKLDGLQIGVVNMADSSSGTSIGLLNFIKGGYNRVSLSNNDLTQVNIEYHSGTARLYTILKAGASVVPDEKMFVFGAGLGHDFILSQRLSLNTQILSENAYLGDWRELSNLYSARLGAGFKLSERIEVFAGPTFSVFVNDQSLASPGYKNLSSNEKGRFGWNLGFTLF